jgi:Ca2+-binding EF-hand superfamily protein
MQGGVRVNDDNIDTIFKLLDINGSGAISYQELCDVLQQKKTPDYTSFVKAERAKRKKE